MSTTVVVLLFGSFAGASLLAISFLLVLVAALVVGWVFESIDTARGFARWDQSVADMANPSDAQGLDGALRKAASSTIGLVGVVVVGAGLLVFGAFCILSAPKQRMVGVDG
jgi:hypothetical protein